MKVAIRGVLAFMVAVATFYFVYWVGGALLFSLNLPEWIPLVGSLAVAVGAAWSVWKYSTSASGDGLLRPIGVGALVVGGISFLAGFFGPILLTPGANQGPLLGIFVTGPLGFVLGAAGGAVYGIVRRRPHTGTQSE